METIQNTKSDVEAAKFLFAYALVPVDGSTPLCGMMFHDVIPYEILSHYFNECIHEAIEFHAADLSNKPFSYPSLIQPVSSEDLDEYEETGMLTRKQLVENFAHVTKHHPALQKIFNV